VGERDRIGEKGEHCVWKRERGGRAALISSSSFAPRDVRALLLLLLLLKLSAATAPASQHLSSSSLSYSAGAAPSEP
jgi:hypothetical protein